ncbi:MAG: hypothetical protein U0840_26975 [Gemmataceae bacterium]
MSTPAVNPGMLASYTVAPPFSSPTCHNDPGTIHLGGNTYRVRNFQTRRPGESLNSAPRTVGQVALLVSPSNSSGSSHDAVELCRKASPTNLPAGAARGKVVLLSENGRSLVYQTDADRGTASLAACGNASAASAVLLAEHLQTSLTRQRLTMADGEVLMQAKVQRASRMHLVEQTWTGIRFEVEQTTLLGHTTAVCRGTLNEYLVVALDSADQLAGFDLDQARACWELARERFGFTDPLRGRLAAVALTGQAHQVKFFTCGRCHPGAPLTGLATLALTAREVSRFADLQHTAEVHHPRGKDILPRVTGDRIDLQPVQVLLQTP